MITPDLLSLWGSMVTIRIVEDRLQKLCLEGLAGDLHFSKGQEAISVGVCAALRDTDYIVTHHRTIAHEIAKGAELRPLLAEILGRETGLNKGLAGEMHVSNPEIRHAFSFQLVGTCLPVATGLAYALRYYRKTDDVVVVFFGDAATSNGQFHEALNIAKIRKVPLLLVCENNGLAGNIRKECYLPTKTVADRMAAYGIRASKIDGNDVDRVFYNTRYAVESIVRRGEPYFIEMETTRLCWHKQGQRDVRTQEELAKLAERDPIVHVEKKMGYLPEKEGIRRAIEHNVDRVLSIVEEDPWPKGV